MKKWILLECLISRQVNALLRRKLLRMESPTANIQAMTLWAWKYSASTMRVTMLTSTPEAPTRANFQKRPAEGTYQKRLSMWLRYSKPWRMVALDTPAWRTWNSKGVSSTLSSGAHTSISSSTLNPVGLNWMPEIAWFFMRKQPATTTSASERRAIPSILRTFSGGCCKSASITQVYSLAPENSSIPVVTAVERPPYRSAPSRRTRRMRPSCSARPRITSGVSSVESSTKTTL